MPCSFTSRILASKWRENQDEGDHGVHRTRATFDFRTRKRELATQKRADMNSPNGCCAMKIQRMFFNDLVNSSGSHLWIGSRSHRVRSRMTPNGKLIPYQSSLALDVEKSKMFRCTAESRTR